MKNGGNKINQNNDHDTIIEIKTMQQVILSELRELKDGTATRISNLENTKLDTKDSYPVLYKESVDRRLTNFDTRINVLETSHTTLRVLLTIGSGILSALVGLIIYHIFNMPKPN